MPEYAKTYECAPSMNPITMRLSEAQACCVIRPYRSWKTSSVGRLGLPDGIVDPAAACTFKNRMVSASSHQIMYSGQHHSHTDHAGHIFKLA